MSKNNMLIVGAIIVIVGGLFWYYNMGGFESYMPNTSATATPTPMTSTNPSVEAKGKVEFLITDAAASMQGVSSIMVTVDSMAVRSDTKGWVEVGGEAKTYDLLALKKSSELKLISDATLEAGVYTEMRFHVSKIMVVDSKGASKEAKLPSGELKIKGEFTVNADKTAVVVFDFLADKSLHITGDGKYIFAPVVKVDIKNDVTVEMATNNVVKVAGGSNSASFTVGMDEK